MAYRAADSMEGSAYSDYLGTQTSVLWPQLHDETSA